MGDLLEFFERVGLSPAVIVMILLALGVVREVWNYLRTRRLSERAARLSERSAAYELEFSRIQTLMEKRYEKICVLRGKVENFDHFSMRVGEGLGRDVRHSEPLSYCHLLEREYWGIRNFAREHSQILGREIQSAMMALTDAGKPLLDDCLGEADIGFLGSGNAARRVIAESEVARKVLDRESVRLPTSVSEVTAKKRGRSPEEELAARWPG